MSTIITDLAAALQAKDAAYLERNRCVALLARMALALGCRAGLARTAIDGWSKEWHGCVYIDLPTGQVSWHYHDSHAHLFAGLPPYEAPWDGHDTPEKYRRVAAAFPPEEIDDDQPPAHLAWNRVRMEAKAISQGLGIRDLLDAVLEFTKASVREEQAPSLVTPTRWPTEATDRVHALLGELAAKEAVCNLLRVQHAEAVAASERWFFEAQRIRGLINSPELNDFAKGVVLEAAHQRERWGTAHDAGKTPPDWFWLLGYLSGKALIAAVNGNTEKAMHHTISSAAALANWHAALSGSSAAMRPDIDPVARGIEAGAAATEGGAA